MTNALRDHRDSVLSQWVETALSTYPADTAKFLRTKKDPFGNPVGATLHRELATLLDGLLDGVVEQQLQSSLEAVMRIRSVQGLSPSAAVAFVFALEGIVEQTHDRLPTGDRDSKALAAFKERVRRLGMRAFDCFVQCREEIYELRVREAKRQVSYLLKKANVNVDEPPPDTGDGRRPG